MSNESKKTLAVKHPELKKSDISVEKTVDELDICVIILIVYVAGVLYYIILTQSVKMLEGLKGG